MLTDEIVSELESVIEEQLSKLVLNSKEFLTFDECTQYTGISHNFLRQQVKDCLPSYEVGGRRTFFKREEVDDWVMKKRAEVGGSHE